MKILFAVIFLLLPSSVSAGTTEAISNRGSSYLKSFSFYHSNARQVDLSGTTHSNGCLKKWPVSAMVLASEYFDPGTTVNSWWFHRCDDWRTSGSPAFASTGLPTHWSNANYLGADMYGPGGGSRYTNYIKPSGVHWKVESLSCWRVSSTYGGAAAWSAATDGENIDIRVGYQTATTAEVSSNVLEMNSVRTFYSPLTIQENFVVANKDSVAGLVVTSKYDTAGGGTPATVVTFLCVANVRVSK